MLDFKAEHWRDSNDYRKVFFRRNRPFLGSIWICSQCWLPMMDGSKMVQVDHIIPPSRYLKRKDGKPVKKNSILATCLNTEVNTSPICSKCNTIKSDKIGFFMILNGFSMKLFIKLTGLIQSIFILWAYFLLLCIHYIRRILLSRINRKMLKQKKGTKYKSKRKVDLKGVIVPILMIILVISIIVISRKL